MAVNCCVDPTLILGLTGAIATETRVAAVTVSVVVPDTVPEIALIVVEPTPAEVARPFDPAALLMVATLAADVLQVAEVVRFWVLPSE